MPNSQVCSSIDILGPRRQAGAGHFAIDEAVAVVDAAQRLIGDRARSKNREQAGFTRLKSALYDYYKAMR